MILNNDTVNKFYNNTNSKLRYDEITTHHNNLYGGVVYYFSSPGRIELVGNHTDHNHGKVLAAAINLDIIAAVTPTTDGTIIVDSIGFEPIRINIVNLDYLSDEVGHSVALVKGVLNYYKENGYKIGGFIATTFSNVPKGAGVSSSAAFEVLIAKIVSKIYNNDSISEVIFSLAAHYAETTYFGKPCGLLDQTAIALGGVSYMDFADPSSLKFDKIVPCFKDIVPILIVAGGDHSDLTEHYSAVRREMEEVAKVVGKANLRDMGEEYFYNNKLALAKKASGRAMLRALHFFTENNRVDDAANALKQGNLIEFCNIVTESGESSYKFLQNCYVPGDKEQTIPLALMLARLEEGVLGLRVHGGGFKGTVLVFVKDIAVNKFVANMTEIFPAVYPLEIRNFGAVCLNDVR